METLNEYVNATQGKKFAVANKTQKSSRNPIWELFKFICNGRKILWNSIVSEYRRWVRPKTDHIRM